MKLHARFAATIAAGTILGASALFGGALATPPPDTISAITPTELREHLSFLASDELGGRYTLSPSFAVAARYLASRLQAYGYQPVGDHGTYFQHFEVIASKPKPEACAASMTIQGVKSELKFGDFTTSDSQDGAASGDIVFVGYGISAPEQHHDDYASLDVRGKLVMIASAENPAGVDDARLKDDQTGARAARAHGAAGVLMLPSARFVKFMQSPQYGARAAQRTSVRLAADAAQTLPTIVLGPDVANKLLASAGMSLDSLFEHAKNGGALEPKPLPASAEVKIAVDATRSTVQNVVGVLEGTDPSLRKQYVALSAHYDHLQTNAQGKIYPGADDDGSGTASLLTIAHALSAHPPKRSVFVIFHAGEEEGLLGSRYNSDVAPAVPLDQIVADLNMDMVGRSKAPGDSNEKDKELTDADTVYLVGADRISKELNRISEQTNQQFEKLKLNYLYNDPRNPERIYYRSDHWNYAKHGIPIIFYFDGTSVDYHQPSDTIDKIDFTKMTRIARLVAETAWRLGNLDHRLAIDSSAAAAGGK